MKPTFNNVSMYKSFKVAGCGVHLKKHTHKKTFASSIFARIHLVEAKKVFHYFKKELRKRPSMMSDFLDIRW